MAGAAVAAFDGFARENAACLEAMKVCSESVVIGQQFLILSFEESAGETHDCFIRSGSAKQDDDGKKACL